MADLPHMAAAPLKGGGWTVDGGGQPGSYRGGRDQVSACENCDGEGCTYCQPTRELGERIARLEQIAQRNGRILERLGKMVTELGRHLREAGPSSPATPQVAPDRDLDGQYGDEQIRKDPKRWEGRSYVGCKMSETTPEYLDAVADFADWKAQKDDEKAAAPANTDEEKAEAAKRKKYAGYARKTAARARGWAARLRAGWKTATEDDKSWD